MVRDQYVHRPAPALPGQGQRDIEADGRVARKCQLAIVAPEEVS